MGIGKCILINGLKNQLLNCNKQQPYLSLFKGELCIRTCTTEQTGGGRLLEVGQTGLNNFKPTTPTTVVSGEIKHFTNLSNEWWNPYGPLIALHSLNAIRVPFIRDGLIGNGQIKHEYINTKNVLKDLNILEVGCGGGILTECLARIHANVTAIDPAENLIKIAQDHVNGNSQLMQRINYKSETIEEHSKNNKNKYDAVIVSEVLEHVIEKPTFLFCCIDTLKPGGSIFITTFDKTICSWIGGILFAEYLLGVVPKHSHNWYNFISPLDTQRILADLNCSTIMVNGFIYEFWKNAWEWTDSTKISYALHAVKLN